MSIFTTVDLVREKARQMLEAEDWSSAQIEIRIGETVDEMLLIMEQHFSNYLTTSKWLTDPPEPANNNPPYIIQNIATIWTVGRCILDAYSSQDEVSNAGRAMIEKANNLLYKVCRAGTIRLRDGTTITGAVSRVETDEFYTAPGEQDLFEKAYYGK